MAETKEKQNFDSSPTKLSGLSPEKYGSTAYKTLSYTPQKLQDNFIYREVTITKLVETEKNKARELESLNSLLEDNIRHLTRENDTLRRSFDQQVEMYKTTIREQEEETKRLIKNLQNEYSLEIQKILERHEDDSKVAQAEKEELERKIEELLGHVDDHQGKIHHHGNTITDMRTEIELLSQKLGNTEEKLIRESDNGRQTADRLNREIDNLNSRLLHEGTTSKQQIDSFHNDRIREIQALKRQHLTDTDKLHSRRDVQMNTKNLELKDIQNVFEKESKRLEDIINNKDRVNEAVGLECRKEKEKLAALTRNYDLEISQLVTEKNHILSDLALVSEERGLLQKQLSQISLVFQMEKGKTNALVHGLQGEIDRKDLGMYSQNKRLLMEVSNLRELLMESSSQMERCKHQLLRMGLEREDVSRLRTMITEQEIQMRMRRI